MKFEEALKLFESYQRNILGRSENTIKNYALDIEGFAKFLGKSDTDAAKKDVERFMVTLSEKGMAAATRARKLSSLQMFYNWLCNNEYAQTNPVQGIAKPKIPQKKVLAMSKDEVQEVIAAAKARNPKHKDFYRNLTLVCLMFSTGLRRNEVVNVRLEDVNIQEQSLLVQKGKGDKQRIAYFNSSTAEVLDDYIQNHRNVYKSAEESEYLFVSQKAGQMCVSAVNRVVNSLFEECGLKEKGFVVHSTRKSFATAVYEATKDIVAVQNLLGHSSPQTTMRYVGANESRNRSAAQMIEF